MKEVTLKFKQAKLTKGTVMFDEVAEEGKHVVGSLYVRKTALKEPYPQELTVTIKS